MIEVATIIGIFAVVVGAVSALYYKMGRLEHKVNFIYDNIKIVVDFKNGK